MTQFYAILVPPAKAGEGRGKLKGLWADEQKVLEYMATRSENEIADWKIITFDDRQNLNGKVGPMREKLRQAAEAAAAERASKPGAGKVVKLQADPIEAKSSGKTSKH